MHVLKYKQTNKQIKRPYHPPVMRELAELAVAPVHKYWHPSVVALREPRILLRFHHAAHARARPQLTEIEEILPTESEFDSEEQKHEGHPQDHVNDTNLQFHPPEARNR